MTATNANQRRGRGSGSVSVPGGQNRKQAELQWEKATYEKLYGHEQKIGSAYIRCHDDDSTVFSGAGRYQAELGHTTGTVRWAPHTNTGNAFLRPRTLTRLKPARSGSEGLCNGRDAMLVARQSDAECVIYDDGLIVQGLSALRTGTRFFADLLR